MNRTVRRQAQKTDIQGDIDKLHATTAMWCWDPHSGRVSVVPWPDTTAISIPYEMTAGACYAFVHELTPAQRQQYVIGEALKLITHYRCDGLAVHTAFSAIREYRDFLSSYEDLYEALWQVTSPPDVTLAKIKQRIPDVKVIGQ